MIEKNGESTPRTYCACVCVASSCSREGCTAPEKGQTRDVGASRSKPRQDYAIEAWADLGREVRESVPEDMMGPKYPLVDMMETTQQQLQRKIQAMNHMIWVGAEGDVQSRFPSQVLFLAPFLVGRVPLLRQTTEKSWHPYSNLFIGGPR